MQTTMSFCWGQVAKRIFNHVETVQHTSLKEQFELFADPVVLLLVRDNESDGRLQRLCSQIGAAVASCSDVGELLAHVASSSVLCPIICILDSATRQQVCSEVEKALEGHFSSTIFQLADRSQASNEIHSGNTIAAKPIQLPLNNEAFTSIFHEFLIKTSQLSGHIRRIRKLESLNEREKILVQLISFGVPNKSSASILKLAEKTVEKCRTGVYRKLNVRSTGELASLVTMANFYRWPKGGKYPFKTSL